jgi:hypothetical protein
MPLPLTRSAPSAVKPGGPAGQPAANRPDEEYFIKMARDKGLAAVGVVRGDVRAALLAVINEEWPPSGRCRAGAMTRRGDDAAWRNSINGAIEYGMGTRWRH